MTTPILVAEAERLSRFYGPTPARVQSYSGRTFEELTRVAAAEFGLDVAQLDAEVWQDFNVNALQAARPDADMLGWLLELRSVTCEDCGRSIEPNDSGLCESCEGARHYDAASGGESVLERIVDEGLSALNDLLSHDAELLQGDPPDDPGLITKEAHVALLSLRNELAKRSTAARRLRELIDREWARVADEEDADIATGRCRPLYDAVAELEGGGR